MIGIITSIDSFTEPFRLSLQNNFDNMVAYYFNGSHFWAHFIPSVVTVNTTFWLVAFFFTYMDLFGKKFLGRYRVQLNSYDNYAPLKKEYLLKMVSLVLQNQIITIAVTYVAVVVKFRLFPVNPNVPTLSRFVFEWIVFVVAREVTFYYVHRVLHHPTLYRILHKQHHELHAPLAIGTLYSHPIDNLLTNNLPVYIGPILVNSHSLTIYPWALYVMLISTYDHSGYHLPFSPLSSVFHDYHHNLGKGNYGLNGLLDWIHGTDVDFKRSKYYPKHRPFFQLDPIKIE